jgi:hypothetical protein
MGFIYYYVFLPFLSVMSELNDEGIIRRIPTSSEEDNIEEGDNESSEHEEDKVVSEVNPFFVSAPGVQPILKNTCKVLQFI